MTFIISPAAAAPRGVHVKNAKKKKRIVFGFNEIVFLVSAQAFCNKEGSIQYNIAPGAIFVGRDFPIAPGFVSGAIQFSYAKKLPLPENSTLDPRLIHAGTGILSGFRGSALNDILTERYWFQARLRETAPHSFNQGAKLLSQYLRPRRVKCRGRLW
jgi:hypothetical protein